MYQLALPHHPHQLKYIRLTLSVCNKAERIKEKIKETQVFFLTVKKFFFPLSIPVYFLDTHESWLLGLKKWSSLSTSHFFIFFLSLSLTRNMRKGSEIESERVKSIFYGLINPNSMLWLMLCSYFDSLQLNMNLCYYYYREYLLLYYSTTLYDSSLNP